MKLKFEITNQHITRTDNEIPVNKSHDYLEAEFQFKTSEWEGLSKIVLFKIPLPNGKERAYAKSLGSADVSLVTVPWEVLQGTVFKVTVFAGDLITANEAIVFMDESGYTENVSGTSNPSPDIFSDIYERLDQVQIIPNWENIGDKPSTFPPEPHNHTSEDVTDFEEQVDYGFDEFLNIITENIRRM